MNLTNVGSQEGAFPDEGNRELGFASARNLKELPGESKETMEMRDILQKNCDHRLTFLLIRVIRVCF